MDFAIAKQLKKSGFPQRGNGTSYVDPICGPDPDNDCMMEHSAYFPTLSELIEACGDFFWELKLTHDGAWKRKYFCIGSKQGENEAPFCDTPEEAVTKLWLTLNKRN